MSVATAHGIRTPRRVEQRKLGRDVRALDAIDDDGLLELVRALVAEHQQVVLPVSRSPRRGRCRSR
jgi:hypothetical protein